MKNNKLYKTIELEEIATNDYTKNNVFNDYGYNLDREYNDFENEDNIIIKVK